MVRIKNIIVGFILFAGSVYPLFASAAMSSPSFIIYADEIGIGGAALSTSTSFSLTDTANQSPVGFTSSTTFLVRGGYVAMDSGNLSMSIDNTSLNLGTLSNTQVNSASAVVTITTDSITGYTLAISSVSGGAITAVGDGTVSAGFTEYGLAVTGQDRLFSDDRAVASGLMLASSSTPVLGGQTSLIFKASISGGTAAGDYAQSVTLTASSNI